VFGIDRQRQYHRPPWFLRGYQPEEVSDPLAAWLFVLTNCRYVDDMEQFGYREVWQLGEETYQTRQGDCEDLAILLADWLEAAGFEARVVLGDTDGSGHAWVVWRQDGQEYLLEATGGRGNYRRVPPRTEFATDYQPQVQFDRAGVWFRTSGKWTGEYYEGGEWSRAPGPAGSRPTSNG
jgi:transglutaminase-like putative cysteine protease